MKRNVSILLIVLLILVISTLILFAEEAKYDFRKTNWGMSKEQVRATEDKKPGFEDDTLLIYSVEFGGYDFACAYHFVEDKLYSSTYSFVAGKRNIANYERLKRLLIKKYGEQMEWKKVIVWDDDLCEFYVKDWENSTGVIEGYLMFRAFWETPTTKIVLRLWDEDYKSIKQRNLNIFYDSKELEEWAEQTKEKEILKDL